MKLYYSKGACSLAVRITINEIGIHCDYESVDLKTKKTETGLDFLKISSKGSVPTLLLDSKEILTENCVIQQYIADKYNATQVLPVLGDMKRYRVLEWLNFISTELHKNCGPLFNPHISEELRENIFRPALKSKLQIAEQQLAKTKYLIGDQFCLADSYLFVVLRWAPHLKVSLVDLPNLTRYFAEVAQRPAVKKSLQEEGLN